MECCIRLWGPGEVIRLLHQLVKRQRFLSQSAYEPTEGCQTPCEFLHISESSWQSYFLYGANLYRICFDSSIRHQEPSSFPAGTPKVHFAGLSFMRYLLRLSNVSLISSKRVLFCL